MRFIGWKSGARTTCRFACALLAVAGAGTLPALAASSIDLEPVRDNTLYEDPLGSVSNALGDHCFAGMTAGAGLRRAVFAFDLSAVPTGSIVLTAELRLTLDRAAGFSGSRPMTLHRAMASWGEGTSVFTGMFSGGGQGVAATANDATWLHRFYPSVLWAAPGGDFDATVAATTLVPETPGQYVWGSTPEMVAVVQSWVNTPATNFGWVLLGDEAVTPSARRFFTREAAAAASRPHLVVTYASLSASETPAARVLRFDPAAPNPFNPSTTLRWEAPRAGFTTITVWNARGALVATPWSGPRPAGPQSLVWQAHDTRGTVLPSGVYLVRLEQAGESRSQRVVLVR